MGTMARQKRARADGEKGALFVEMALTLPLYLFVVVFTIDVIRASFTAAMVQYAADNAAFCGARVHVTEADTPRFGVGRSSEKFRTGGDVHAYRASVCQEDFPDAPSLAAPQGYLGYALKNLRNLQLSNGRDVRISVASPMWQTDENGSCEYIKSRYGTITLRSRTHSGGTTTSTTQTSLSNLPLCTGGDGGLAVLTVSVRYKTVLDKFLEIMGLPRPPWWINGYGLARNELPYV